MECRCWVALWGADNCRCRGLCQSCTQPSPMGHRSRELLRHSLWPHSWHGNPLLHIPLMTPSIVP